VTDVMLRSFFSRRHDISNNQKFSGERHSSLPRPFPRRKGGGHNLCPLSCIHIGLHNYILLYVAQQNFKISASLSVRMPEICTKCAISRSNYQKISGEGAVPHPRCDPRAKILPTPLYCGMRCLGMLPDRVLFVILSFSAI